MGADTHTHNKQMLTVCLNGVDAEATLPTNVKNLIRNKQPDTHTHFAATAVGIGVAVGMALCLVVLGAASQPSNQFGLILERYELSSGVVAVNSRVLAVCCEFRLRKRVVNVVFGIIATLFGKSYIFLLKN